jgi:RNA polymerase sigma factor (sigma-70 family)
LSEPERCADRDRAGGEPGAVEELLAAHLPALRAFVRLRMGPTLRMKESASDLVQSVCREILEHADRYRFPGEENFRSWLYTTALRVVKNKAKYWQRDKRDAGREEARFFGSASRPDRALSDCYGSVITPSRQLRAKEEIERFERAFETLPEDHQEVISLSRIVGLPHKQVGELMGRTEAATRQLLRRALAGLALALEISPVLPRARS